MTTYTALLYGLIQGVTEFLPVSSSAHLAVLPTFLGIEDPGVVFDLMMHVGTALALLVYFRREVMDLIRGLCSSRSKHRAFSLNYLVANVVSFVVVLILLKSARESGRGHLLIVFNLVLFAILMWAADYWGKGKNVSNCPLEKKIFFLKASLIGLAQAIAIFPGVSRSGATLSISRAMGLSRAHAASFSFLLSIPIILIGALEHGIEMIGSGHALHVVPSLIGGATAFFTGLIVIHYFLKCLPRIGLWVFSVYRILLAIFILWTIRQ
jgi:undecaprenyl-diphosphatase